MSGTARALFVVIALLLALGVVMVASTSPTVSRERYGSEWVLLRNHLLYVGLGLVVMGLAAFCPTGLVGRLSPWLLAAALVLCVVVLSPLGYAAGGARRWIRFGPLGLQPTELLKLALVTFPAWYLSRREGRAAELWRGVVPVAGLAGLCMGLVMLQPDYSSALILGVIVLAVLFAAGARLGHLACLSAPSIPAAAALALAEPYRFKRIVGFLRPWDNPGDSGYQIIQSMVGIVSGGLFGVGLGCGRQKLFYLPESHTDFIFSIIGEELGLVGAAVVVGLFAALVCLGMRAARRASDGFSSLLATGVVVLIGMQAALHMAVVVGLVPPTGVTLPLVSYGGSSMVFTLAACGLLLRVACDEAETGRRPKASAGRPAREAVVRRRQMRFAGIPPV